MKIKQLNVGPETTPVEIVDHMLNSLGGDFQELNARLLGNGLNMIIVVAKHEHDHEKERTHVTSSVVKLGKKTVLLHKINRVRDEILNDLTNDGVEYLRTQLEEI